MKVKDIMTDKVIKIAPQESVEVAARTLTQYNIGVLPVCRTDGTLCGLVTDRDLVTRCIASNLDPAATPVKKIMTGQVISVTEDMEAGTAACIMGVKQVHRLPVVENGKITGMVSLGDVAKENTLDAADALGGIASNITEGESG